MIKKIIVSIAIILPIVCFAAGSASAAEYSSYSVELNDVKLDASTYVEGETLYLPLRAVSETLGYTVGWSGKDHTVTLTSAEDNMLISFDTFSMTEGDHQCYIDNQIINGMAYMSEDFFNDSMGLKVTYDNPDRIISLESVTGNEITIKTEQEKSRADKINISLQYPQISGLKSQVVEDRINSVFKQEATAAKQEGLENAKNYSEDTAGYKFETYFNYRIKYNQNNLLSVVFLNYQYTGGVQGNTSQTAFTYDLQTGKKCSLVDLIKAGFSYSVPFNNLANGELNTIATSSGIFADQAYYLDNSGVTVYSKPYGYVPHAPEIQPPITPNYLGLLLKDGVKNTFNVGDISSVILKGNPTTGYTWQYIIDDESIIKMDSESSVLDSDLTGAGSSFSWNFKALKVGETKITFKYYRVWEGEATAIQTVEYLIKVE